MMTDKKWTPGPWVATDSGTMVLAKDDEVLADVFGERFTANAHLIAAAPDLYDALEAVTDLYLEALGRLDGHDSGMIRCEDSEGQALAALAKARGEK